MAAKKAAKTEEAVDPTGLEMMQVQVARQALALLTNNLAWQTELQSRVANGTGLDPKGRNLEQECGHPQDEPTLDQYAQVYYHHTLGGRVVNALPDECFAVEPEVYEDSDPETLTRFEAGVAEVLGRHLDFWETVKRCDRLSRYGRYGGLVLGVDDGRDPAEPLGTVSGPDKLLYLLPGGEHELEISQVDRDPRSPRFGWPTEYTWTVGDPDGEAGTTEVTVHHTRVVHVADNLAGGSGVYGRPAMEPVFNRLLDLRKILGASAEGFYKGAFPGIAFQTLAELAGRTTMNKNSLKEEWALYQNGLQRFLALDGLEAKTLAPNAADPTPFAMLQVMMIAADIDTPMKVLLGTQQGHLAGTEDTVRWRGKVRGRQEGHCTRRIVLPLFERLVACGVLPPLRSPSAKPKVWWPDVNLSGPKDTADAAVKITQALLQYVTSGAELVMPLPFFLSEVLRLPQELVERVVAKAGTAEHTKDAWKDPSAPGSGAGKADASQTRAGTSRNGLGGN